MPRSTQDLTSAAATLACVAALIALALLEKPIPAELAGFAGLAAGWLFRGPANGAVANLRGPP